MFKFCFGDKPFNIALRACNIKVLQPAFLIFPIKLFKYSKSSISSTPILVFAVTGILQELTISFIQSETRSGSFIKQAPNIFF